MKKQMFLTFMLLVFVLPLLISSCHNRLPIELSSNIILYDKPLDVIRVNVQGKWNLVKVSGGICGTCPLKIVKNPYMIIRGDSIVSGNDSLGITLDTIIVWKRDKDVFGDYTYLLSYRDSKSYVFPIYTIVDRIENDTLILIDNASDPFYYNYLKN